LENRNRSEWDEISTPERALSETTQWSLTEERNEKLKDRPFWTVEQEKNRMSYTSGNTDYPPMLASWNSQMYVCIQLHEILNRS
jgi:hypothetical protein